MSRAGDVARIDAALSDFIAGRLEQDAALLRSLGANPDEVETFLDRQRQDYAEAWLCQLPGLVAQLAGATLSEASRRLQ